MKKKLNKSVPTELKTCYYKWSGTRIKTTMKLISNFVRFELQERDKNTNTHTNIRYLFVIELVQHWTTNNSSSKKNTHADTHRDALKWNEKNCNWGLLTASPNTWFWHICATHLIGFIWTRQWTAQRRLSRAIREAIDKHFVSPVPGRLIKNSRNLWFFEKRWSDWFVDKLGLLPSYWHWCAGSLCLRKTDTHTHAHDIDADKICGKRKPIPINCPNKKMILKWKKNPYM